MADWELYRSIHKGLGTVVEVKIDRKSKLISRQFKEGGITVNGSPTSHDPAVINEFFKNEVQWLEKLQGDWIPKTIDIDLESQTVIQEYYGEDLLCIKGQLPQKLPDLEDQVIEMYKFFKEKNVFKRNGSLSNMCQRNGRIIAFDFKWATVRPDGLEKELFSYDNYLNKISTSLPQKLRELL